MTVWRAITLLCSLALTGAAIYLAPVQAGGLTSFSVVDGISMNPKLHAGDLVVSRASPAYKVGDAVLYRNQILHREVLHRIIKIQDGHYYFKGDNNDFVDPGYATRNELVGKLWFFVPHAGTALTWLGKPSHSAVVAAAVTLLLLVLGTGASSSRRKRRKRAGGLVAATPRRLFHRPRKTAENAVFFGAGSLACVVALVAFTTPLHRSAAIQGAYVQRGSFAYSGPASGLAGVYPSGSVRTGQPIFLAGVKHLRVRFTYHFDTSRPHSVKGTAAMRVLISSDAISWHDVVVMDAKSFSGDSVTVSDTLDLVQVQAIAQRLETASGAVGADYQLNIQPVIKVHGLVGGTKIADTFAPALPMSLTQAMLKIVPPAPQVLPGATYTTPTAASQLNAALNPTKSGTVPGTTANTLSLLRYSIPVSDFRGLALGLAALALLALLLKPLRPKREIWSPERRIAHRHGCTLVNVDEIAAAPETAIVTVPHFEDLAVLAEQQDEPIMFAAGEYRSSYAVGHGRHLYVFDAPVAVEPLPSPAPAPRHRPHRPSWPHRPRLVHWIGGLTLVMLLASLGVVFTATNTVPPSNAGTVNIPAATAQMAPAVCSSLGLTSTMYVGDNTFGNTQSHVLIIGRSTKDTINDKGLYDCIVAGTGPDVVMADPTSICIVNSNPSASYKGCQTR